MTALPRIYIVGLGISLAALGTPTSVGAAPVNLVNNGDFSGGNTGFGSDYVRNPELGWDPATFTITDDPALWHPSFITLGDHTTGTGRMFVGNGSTAQGSTVWQSQTIDVAAGLDYYFEAFVSNVCCDNFLRTQGVGGPNPKGPSGPTVERQSEVEHRFAVGPEEVVTADVADKGFEVVVQACSDVDGLGLPDSAALGRAPISNDPPAGSGRVVPERDE